MSPPAAPRPLPSPSLSPSIVSLLNSTDDHPTPFDHDYFASAAGSPHPAEQPFAHHVGPDPACPRPRPRSSHKRTRPTSSSSSSPCSHPPDAAPPTHPDFESEGSMEPPTTRPRRSSSISSNPPAAAPPPPPPAPTAPAPPPAPSASTSASASASASASSSRQLPPPPPPTAPLQRRPSDFPLEPSIFNVEPIDEFTREVADWIWGFCAGLDWDKVEIEAKIGLLVDTRNGGQRVQLPVPCEAILTDDAGLRFESNMTVNQHKSFNRLLNSRVEESATPSYPFAPVRYAHTRELDTFHTVALAGQGTAKVRVTTDQKNKSKVQAVEKVRVANMNPEALLRLEVPVPEAPPTHSRLKDRISYSHQLFQVDLTQVTSSGKPQHPTHELEIEFKDAKALLEEAAKEQRGEQSAYVDGVQGLLNNVRMLIRNASEP
ncbi:SPOSA6832_02717, partial [Sporobolomyces salmonicolor]